MAAFRKVTAEYPSIGRVAAVAIKNQPTIPLNDEDTPPRMTQPVPPKTAKQSRMQAIANSAAFAFAMIEQGGSSLYSTLALQVTDVEVLRP